MKHKMHQRKDNATDLINLVKYSNKDGLELNKVLTSKSIAIIRNLTGVSNHTET